VTLFLGILFSSIGGVYAFYGKKSYDASFLVCGVLLMLYPYVVPGALLMTLVGVALVMFPIARRNEWV
jgi:ABC-type dipeptide/oligopeptide/nickel transport system permease component